MRGLPADAVPSEQDLAAMDAAAAQKQQDALALAKASQPQTQPGQTGKPPAQVGQTSDNMPTGDKKPVAANSYSTAEQVAMFEAAARIVAEGA